MLITGFAALLWGFILAVVLTGYLSTRLWRRFKPALTTHRADPAKIMALEHELFPGLEHTGCRTCIQQKQCRSLAHDAAQRRLWEAARGPAFDTSGHGLLYFSRVEEMRPLNVYEMAARSELLAAMADAARRP